MFNFLLWRIEPFVFELAISHFLEVDMNRRLIEQIRQSFVLISSDMLAKRDLKSSIEHSKTLLRKLRDDYPSEKDPARHIVTLVFDSLAYTPREELTPTGINLLDSVIEAFSRGAIDQPALDATSDCIQKSLLFCPFPSVEC